MSQFTDPFSSHQVTTSATRGPLRGPPSGALIAVVLCLCLGGCLVWWRAAQHAAAERARAQAWLQGPAASLEAGLNRALSATDSLAMLVRRGGGRLADFKSIGAELLAARPGLASLELQPGGITTDVVPRVGNERAIGANILRDPATLLAVQSRQQAIIGPVVLGRGQAGLVGRMAVFQRDAKGKESLWGLVSASVALPDIVAQAKLDRLADQGYDYLFWAVPPSPLKPVPIANRGKPALSDAEQQAFAVGNLELRLAVRPRGGWVRLSPLACESAVVAAIAGLLGLCVRVRENGSRLRAELVESTIRATQEQERSAQIEGQLRSLKAAGATELVASTQAAEGLRAKLLEAEKHLRAGQDRCDRLQEELRATKERHASEATAAKEAAAVLRVTLQETAAQLRLSRGQTARAEEELRLANAKAEESDRVQADLLASLDSRRRAQTAGVPGHKPETALTKAEPTMAEPTVAEPTVAEPTVAEPTGGEPAVAERAEAETTILEPAVAEPTNGEPAKDEPVEAQPAAAQPAQTEIVAIEAAEVEAPEPEAAAVEPTGTTASGPIAASALIEPELTREPEPASAAVNAESLAPIGVETTKARAGEAEAEPEAAIETAEPSPTKPGKAPRPKKSEDSAQLSLFAMESDTDEEKEPAPVLKPEGESKVRIPRKSAHTPAGETSKIAPMPTLNRPVFKKKASELYVLLTEADPGAKDCLADYRQELRPGFTPEAFEAFEKHVNGLAFHEALELLVKAARRQGISL